MLSVIPVAVAISSVSWECTFTFVRTISADHRGNNIIHIRSVRFKLFDAFSPEPVQQEQSQEAVATDKMGKYTHLSKITL